MVCSSTWLVVLGLSLFHIPSHSKGPDHVLDDSFKYITRPDIEAPRWNITVYDEDLVSPGYWFVESYDFLDQSLVNGGKWTAPEIFDEKGELIWSGSYLSQQYDTFDFRMSNVLGEDMLTFLYPRNRTAIVLDNHFNIDKVFQTSSPEDELDNMHDLLFVDHGTRALFFYDEVRNLSASQSEAIGFTDGNCAVRENSFREFDVKKNEVVFSWSTSEHVDMIESTFTEHTLQDRCTSDAKGWDFVHANSLDKFPDDGSYLMSGRHTDAIYKIAPDGSITWRLGGVKSDFNADFKFVRQHHARIREHNLTHTIISIFDNAKAEDTEDAPSPYSRGIIVALKTNVHPMTATLLSEYPHPDGPGAFTLGRGSTQLLPNGNVFSCWVHGCLHSEHTADGKLVMEARVKQEWLKSYRSYKYSFVGRPDRPPDVYSATTNTDGGDSAPMTVVHVSWNGATEVATWKMYKTNEEGKRMTEPVASLPKSGFETELSCGGYATYVVLEAVDMNGDVLGKSGVVETVVKSPLPDAIIQQEAKWLENVGNMKLDTGTDSWTSKASYRNPIVSFVTVLVCTAVLVFGGRALWRAKRMKKWFSKHPRGPSYELVSNGRHDDLFALDEEDSTDLSKSP